MNRRAWTARVPVIVVGVMTGVLAACYLGIFRGELAGDDNSYHYAEVARIAQAVDQGDWDWWNPAANGGFASGFYYQLIPAAVPGLLAGFFGDPLFWFQLATLIPLVLIPVAAYRALRVLELDPWGALGGAIALAFCTGNNRWGQGSDGVLMAGIYTQGWALCAFPLAFAHGCRWLRDGSQLGPAVGWGLFVGLCHPLAGVALAPVLLVVALALIPPARPRWSPLVRLAALGALLLVGSAPAWLPVIVYYEGFGGFPHRVSDEVGPGFVGLGKWLIGGDLLDYERSIAGYTLPILSVLAGPAFVYAVVATALRRPGRLWPLWLAASVLAVILGVGKYLPKTDDDLFPAVRFLGPMQLMLALAIGAAVGNGVAWAVRSLDRVDMGEIAQGVLAAITGLVVIVFSVPAINELQARARVAGDWKEIHRDELDLLLPVIRDAAPGRFQTRGLDNHWFIQVPYIYTGKPAVVAWGGPALQSSPNFAYLYATPHPGRIAWIYDSPLLITRRNKPEYGGHVLATTEHFELRELPNPGLIGPVQVSDVLPPGRKATRAAVLAWQASADPFANRVRAHHGHGGAGPPPDGDARDIRHHGSRITATLAVRAPTTFAIRETWHPRWRATLEGKPVAIRRITPDMMAIDAPVGAARLELRFERPVWMWLAYLLIPMTILIGSFASRSPGWDD